MYISLTAKLLNFVQPRYVFSCLWCVFMLIEYIGDTCTGALYNYVAIKINLYVAI